MFPSEFSTDMRPSSRGKATNLSHQPRSSRTYESSVFAAQAESQPVPPSRSSRTFESSFKFDNFGVSSTDEARLPFRNPNATRQQVNKGHFLDGMTADAAHFKGGIKILSRPSTAAVECAEEGPTPAGMRRSQEGPAATRRHYGSRLEGGSRVFAAGEGPEATKPAKKQVQAPQVPQAGDRFTTKRMFDSAGQQEDHVTEAFKAAEEGRQSSGGGRKLTDKGSMGWGDKTIPNAKSSTASGRRSFGYTNQTSQDNVLGAN